MLRMILSGIGAGPCTCSSLAESAGIGLSELHTALELLVERGYVTRSGCEALVGCAGGCRSCMACRAPACQRPVATYSLTEKGQRMTQ